MLVVMVEMMMVMMVATDDPPGESVVLPLPLRRPNRARTILKDLTKHNQHYRQMFHQYMMGPYHQLDLADAVLLDVLSAAEVGRAKLVWPVGKTSLVAKHIGHCDPLVIL